MMVERDILIRIHVTKYTTSCIHY